MMIKNLILFGLLVFLACKPNKQNEMTQVSNNSTKNQNRSMNTDEFSQFWKKFKVIALNFDRKKIKEMSLDSLECEGNQISIDVFIDNHFTKVFDKKLSQRISSGQEIEFIDREVFLDYFRPYIQKKLAPGNQVIKEVVITKDVSPQGEPKIIMIRFLKVNGLYKFFGYDKIGGN